MNNEIAARIFDELYDEDDLNELHKKKVIAQPLGFKLSTIAIIECELDEHLRRLTEENAKLRELVEFAFNEGAEEGFYGGGYFSMSKSQELLNQLKEQNQ